MNSSPKWAIILLGGLASATLSFLPLLVHPGLIFLSYLAPLPLYLIGLGRGLSPLYGAAFLAASLVFIVEGLAAGAEFFVLSTLGPVFLINRALLNRKKSGKTYWYPPSLLLRDFTLASAVVLALALGVYLYLAQGESVDIFIKNFLAVFDKDGTLKNAESLLKTLFSFLPGFLALSWALMMLVNASLAQGLLVRFQKNLRPSPTLSDLQAPKYLPLALGLSLVLAMVGVGSLELLGKNFAFILMFPFFLIGLGMVHSWLHKTSYTTLGLTLFYASLLILFWPLFIVVFLGLTKPWIEKFFSLK